MRNLKIRKDQSRVSNKIRKQTRRNMAKRFACFETRAMMVRPICPLNIQKRDFVLYRLLLANHELLGGLGKESGKRRFGFASPPSLPAARMETQSRSGKTCRIGGRIVAVPTGLERRCVRIARFYPLRGHVLVDLYFRKLPRIALWQDCSMEGVL